MRRAPSAPSPSGRRTATAAAARCRAWPARRRRSRTGWHRPRPAARSPRRCRACPAASITLNARYGLHAGSGERYSMRVAIGLPRLAIGTRISPLRLLRAQRDVHRRLEAGHQPLVAVDGLVGDRGDLGGVAQQAGHELLGDRRQVVAVVVVEERVVVAAEQRQVGVHARALHALERLGHERGVHARARRRPPSRPGGTSSRCRPSSARRCGAGRSRAGSGASSWKLYSTGMLIVSSVRIVCLRSEPATSLVVRSKKPPSSSGCGGCPGSGGAK